MVENRCSRCHRFKKDPPSPELGHDGSQAESKCKLEHHPFPCNFIETDDTVCEFHTNEHFEDTNATANAAKAADIEGKFHAQSLELGQMKAEMLEMRNLMVSMRTMPATTASLANISVQATVTSVTTAITSTTTSLLGPQVSILQQPGHGSLTSDAQNLIELNNRGGVTGNVLQGYNGMTMKDLQQDKSIANEVQRQLNDLIANVPALQKVVAGQVQVPALPTSVSSHTQKQRIRDANYPPPHVAYQAIQAGAAGGCAPNEQPRDDMNLLDMDTVLGLKVREKQYRPHEFASRGNFYYANNINDKNITLPLYVYGYLKHCVILLSGLVPVTEGEVEARLANLMNVMEIVSNNSTLNDFEHTAWQLGKGYGDRVFNDIQQGVRSWPDLPNNVLPDVFLHVKDMVDMQAKKKEPRGTRGGNKGRGSGQEKSSSDRQVRDKPMVCSTYNDFYTGSGCAYEFNNDRKCNYEHFCSTCFTSNGNKVLHKSRFCTGVSSGATAVVTTSG